MKTILTKLATLGFAIGAFFATEASANSLNAKIAFPKINTPEQINAYKNNLMKRVPNTPNLNGVPLPKDAENYLQSPLNARKAAPSMLEQLPADAVFPGEFEEVDGILVSFPYVAIDSSKTKVLEPFIAGYGIWVDNSTNDAYLLPIAHYIPQFQAFEDRTFSDLYVNLIHAIQTQTTAYVVIGLPKDTVAIKEYAESLGKPFNNVKWISYITNSFWFRDCGAVGFYYDNLDKIGLLDFEYYSGRAMDDDINYALSDITGYPLVFSPLETEGGNILVDGYGKLYTSDQYYLANSDTVGQYYITNSSELAIRKKEPLTKAQADEQLKADMNLKDLHVMQSLKYDGGTGHIDLYADMPNENEMVFAKFSESQKKMTDYKIVNKNIDQILSLTSYQNVKYKAHYVPVPNDDDGLPFNTNKTYAEKTRTFVNHLLVNKAIIQPVFNDGETGDIEGDNKALAELQKAYPGYNIIPIDMRYLDGSGGSIHCITKQIPAKNPIRISHKPIQTEDYDMATGKVSITAEIKSNLELSDTKVFYVMNAKPVSKVSNNLQDKQWKEATLTLGADGKYTATLEGTPNTELASIDYYISATNPKKTMTSPITAPAGYHNVDFMNSSVEEVATNDLMCYPNPARENLYVNLGMTAEDGTINVRIVDASGKVVYANSFVNTDSLPTMSINTNSFPAGSYILSVTSANKSNSGKFTVIK